MTKDRLDVDAAVLGSEGCKAAGRLLELALATDAVAAPRLVPRHGDVYEALEEVSLEGLRCAPRVLERFVSPEVLAAADQLEPLFEKLRSRL